MEPILRRSKIESILNSLSTKRIGVLGDFALDGYWHADMTLSQLSREAPLYNRPITNEIYYPGGAANLAWNLAELGIGEIKAFTVFGEDWRGDQLKNLLKEKGVNTEAVLHEPDWLTPLFGKITLSGLGNQQEDARIDFLNQKELPKNIEIIFANLLKNNIKDLSAIIIADYSIFGVVTPKIKEVVEKIKDQNPNLLFIVDSRERFSEFKNMTIKPNFFEAIQLFFPDTDPQFIDFKTLSQAGINWSRKNCCSVYITLGEKGCLICDKSGSQLVDAFPVTPPLDIVGAGDSFMAGLTSGLVTGLLPEEAVFLANLIASVTIKKINITGTASKPEILDAYDYYFAN